MVKNVPKELVITQTGGLASATFLGRLQEMVIFQIYFPKNLKNVLECLSSSVSLYKVLRF